ncbi:to 3 [Limtongia smithiae]|uniref:to 3 n=1 Tax=Limtongia smithiae TaxID=1125753 RepID=UPI0034CE4FFD
MALREYNIVVLGAGGVGKSALTVQFAQGVFLNSYDPTIEDSYRREVSVDGRQCEVEILDTAGVEQFTAMRELYIKNGQGFLIVFSVTDRDSFKELEKLHDQVVRIKDSANVPFVLAGNKSDLAHARTVSFLEAKQLAHSWGTTSFYETSARSGAHVSDVFVDLVRQIQRRDSATLAADKESLASTSLTLDTGRASPVSSASSNTSRSPASSSGFYSRHFSEKEHKHSYSSTTDQIFVAKDCNSKLNAAFPQSGKRAKNKKRGGLCVIL